MYLFLPILYKPKYNNQNISNTKDRPNHVKSKYIILYFYYYPQSYYILIVLKCTSPIHLNWLGTKTGNKEKQLACKLGKQKISLISTSKGQQLTRCILFAKIQDSALSTWLIGLCLGELTQTKTRPHTHLLGCLH